MPERTIYEQLVGTTVDNATIEQLDFTRNTYIDAKSVEYWKGVITISKILDASRTYPHGLSIPTAGKCTGAAVASEANHDFQPSGSEVWSVEGISIVAGAGTAVCTVSLNDGSITVPMHAGTASTTESSFFPFEAPFQITNSLYLNIANADTSNAVTAKLAYQVVSL